MLVKALVLLTAAAAHGRPFQGKQRHIDRAWNYLKKFGYIAPEEPYSTMALSDATGYFQTFTGLNVTCEETGRRIPLMIQCSRGLE